MLLISPQSYTVQCIQIFQINLTHRTLCNGGALATHSGLSCTKKIPLIHNGLNLFLRRHSYVWQEKASKFCPILDIQEPLMYFHGNKAKVVQKLKFGHFGPWVEQLKLFYEITWYCHIFKSKIIVKAIKWKIVFVIVTENLNFMS